MNNTTKLIIAVIAVVVIAGGAILLTGNKSGNSDTNGGTTNTPGTSDTSGDTQLADDEIAATITYTNSGFSPSSVTVPSGGAVRIINNSDDDVAPSSDNHPEHTLNPELNFPDIEPGQSATVVATEKGTWGIHNHYQDDHRATIVVE